MGSWRKYGGAALIWALVGLVSGFAYENGLDRLLGENINPAVAAADAAIVGRASVIDGDTIKINGQRIRLFGIDAPESGQPCRDTDGHDYPCGRHAETALVAKIGSQTVSCEGKGIDRYQRIVAVCRAGGAELNMWMVREGWAVAYVRYSRRYVPAEADAKVARRGIWRGTFTPPETWRHSSRL